MDALHHVGTAAPGSVTSENDEGHRANDAPQDQIQFEQRDFAADAGEDKAFAMMQAWAALCGCTLHELSDGAYLVGRWNYGKVVPCLRAVGDMLRQIGGR